MRLSTAWAVLLLAFSLSASASAQAPAVFGYRDFTQQSKWDAAHAN